MSKEVQAVSAADMIAAAKARQRTPFFKLSSGVANFRIVGKPIEIRQNVYKLGGQITNSLDGAWLINNNQLREAALKAKKISEADVKAYATYGDPFVMLGSQFEALGLDVPKDVWPQTRFVWPVVDRSSDSQEICRFDSSKKFKTCIDAELDGDYPDLFNAEKGFDIKVVGNGKDGFSRRYQDPKVARDASPVGFEYVVPNFTNAILGGALPFLERVKHLFAVHADNCAVVGIVPASFNIKDALLEEVA